MLNYQHPSRSTSASGEGRTAAPVSTPPAPPAAPRPSGARRGPRPVAPRRPAQVRALSIPRVVHLILLVMTGGAWLVVGWLDSPARARMVNRRREARYARAMEDYRNALALWEAGS
jgi:hypothetical protein